MAAVKGIMSFSAVNRTAYSGCFYSHPRVGNLTTRPAESLSLSLSFNPPWLPLQKLVGVCVSRESFGAFGGTGLGFQGKAKKDLMVVLRVSPQEPIRAQGNKRATLDFKRLCRDGKVESALEAMDEMEKNGVLVDSLDLVKLLQVCEARKLVGAAKRVLDYATRSLSGTVVFNKLVRVYCKWGDTRTARNVFEEMPMRDLDSWNRMLIGLAENGEGEEALGVFSRMKKEGVKPDGSTFLGIIMACGCLGTVLSGQKHFMSMSRDYGITPSMEHYVAIVDLLGRAGKIAEAKEFIANMPIEPSSVVRETLQKHFPTETKGKLGKQKPPPSSEHKSRRKVKGKRIRKGRKPAPYKIPQGVIHVSATFNNTFVTVTDLRGKVFSWSSAGLCGFNNTRRGTPFAAETAARDAIQWAMKQGLRRAEVMIKGAGLGRDAALRAIRRSGIFLSFIRDVTPLPHNGCRPPKKRRV